MRDSCKESTSCGIVIEEKKKRKKERVKLIIGYAHSLSLCTVGVRDDVRLQVEFARRFGQGVVKELRFGMNGSSAEGARRKRE